MNQSYAKKKFDPSTYNYIYRYQDHISINQEQAPVIHIGQITGGRSNPGPGIRPIQGKVYATTPG